MNVEFVAIPIVTHDGIVMKYHEHLYIWDRMGTAKAKVDAFTISPAAKPCVLWFGPD